MNQSWGGPEDAEAAPVGYRPDLHWVNVLTVDEREEHLYAGVKNAHGAQLWRFDGRKWEFIGGEGRNGDWRSDTCDHVYALAWHQGRLYAGMQDFQTHDDRDVPEAGNAEIYRFDAKRWELIAGRGINASWNEADAARWVYQLLSLDDVLYAAVARRGVRGLHWVGEVWRFADERWQRLAGEGIRDSRNDECSNIVASLIGYQGKLVVGYNASEALRENSFGNVWAWNPDEEVWRELRLPVECGDPSLVKRQTMFNTSLVYNGHLVMGGGGTSGDLALWLLDISENTWKCFAHPQMRRFAGPDGMETWNTCRYGYSMAEYQGDLITGFKGINGTAHFWRCRPER